jgi:folate-binding protein YgfZ
MDIDAYNPIRSGGVGFYEQQHGLIAVWGKEAIPFLDGMITNDMKTLADGEQMLAAFPNAQGRLLAVVRVLRQGDRFLIETEDATRAKVFNNLFRFTFAGEFFVEDLTEKYRFFELYNPPGTQAPSPASPPSGDTDLADDQVVFTPIRSTASLNCLRSHEADSFCRELIDSGGVEISDDLYETLRIESGIPKYGVDMDETTIIPELGLDSLISYNKGCYIGQEIIARIHFRGHVAKQMTGLILSEPPALAGEFQPGAELISVDGKNAGRITSVTSSPKLEKTIALGFVRYDYLSAGTVVRANEREVSINTLPFLN